MIIKTEKEVVLPNWVTQEERHLLNINFNNGVVILQKGIRQFIFPISRLISIEE